MKPGYKQTEVGAIPLDWNAVPIKTIATHVGDGLHGTPAYSLDGQYFFINGNNLHDGEIVVANDTKSVAHSEFIKHRKPLSDNSILMSINGTVGNLALFNGESIVLGKSAAYLNVKTNVCRQFVYQVLQTQIVKRQFFDGLTGSTIGNLGLATIRQTHIPIPPTDVEQRAIAEALSDVDALLGALDRLIAKKRDLKQAAMQQLLTGQTRLPGFHGEWEVKRLGEIATFYKGKGLPKNLISASGAEPCIHYGELFTRYPETIGEIFSRTDCSAGAVRSVANDVLMPTSDVTPRGLAKASCVRVDGVILGGDILVIRSNAKQIFGSFLSRLIRYEEAQVLQLVTGSTVFHLYGSDMKKFTFYIPPLPEQTAIAEVLSDMDAELAALEQRRDKTRALKQGMMQELLTGRIRLVRPDSTVVSLPDREQSKSAKGAAHNRQIEEAAMLGVLAALCGTEHYPLARVRRTKLTYLFQRHLGQQTDMYLKKAAGPYNPGTRYKGPEGIAVKNGYARVHHNGTYEGFVGGDKVSQARAYLEKWHGADALSWMEQLRFKKTDELELLATVDMAMQDLLAAAKSVSMQAVKRVIHDHPEWEAKLEREIFSDENLQRAIQECSELFA